MTARCGWCRSKFIAEAQNEWNVFQITGWTKKFLRVCGYCERKVYNKLTLNDGQLLWLIKADGTRNIFSSRIDFEKQYVELDVKCEVGVYFATHWPLPLQQAWLAKDTCNKLTPHCFHRAIGHSLQFGWRSYPHTATWVHDSFEETTTLFNNFVEERHLQNVPWQVVCTDHCGISRDCFGLEPQELETFCFPDKDDNLCFFDDLKTLDHELLCLYRNNRDIQDELWWSASPDAIEHLDKQVAIKRKKVERMEKALQIMKEKKLNE